MPDTVSNARLHNQHILASSFESPADVVGWFGAMQAQDFQAAKWAIGLRTKNLTDKTIEQAFNQGEILRTHIMRPTWHFVTPKDIRWMLALTSARVHAFNGHYYRKSGLSKDIFKKSTSVLQQALEGGKQRTRTQLQQALVAAHMPVQDMGLTYTIMQAELDGVVCSGPRIGKQFTYMLLEERVSQCDDISRDEALGELTKRYFQSHGPAQIQDFVWWSGLTAVDAKRGLEIAQVKQQDTEGKTYWATSRTQTHQSGKAQLIPPFDEYFVAYKDRSDILDGRYSKEMNFGGGMIVGAIVFNGIIIGTWKRTIHKKHIALVLKPFTTFEKSEYAEIANAAENYGKFHALPVSLS